MTATARLLEQRSVGHVQLRMEHDGIAVMREAGSAKCRMPRGSNEAILINTSGGLAGGDHVSITAEAGVGAHLTLTTQAAERVYRTLGPAAEVEVTLKVGANATLFWMPQETILFEGSALSRRLHVELDEGASFFAVEPIVFGRTERGERVENISVHDRWDMRQNGKLHHAERFAIGPTWQKSPASFGENFATASLLLISPKAEALIDDVRKHLGPRDGASAWNGKLVARLLAKDGYRLRKTLVTVFEACLGKEHMPKCWTF
jgi:urease accessory protein